jgi:hypothetical protein
LLNIATYRPKLFDMVTIKSLNNVFPFTLFVLPCIVKRYGVP